MATGQRDLAVRDIRGPLASQIDWFTPEGEKHFDPVTVITVLASVLLTSFLAGFTAEAKKTAEDMGKRTFRYLAAQFKRHLAGGAEVERDELDELADEAPELARSVSRDDLAVYASRAEVHVRLFLEAEMPADRAAQLAAQVRSAAARHVLAG